MSMPTPTLMPSSTMNPAQPETSAFHTRRSPTRPGFRSLILSLIVLICLGTGGPLSAQVFISEFMASNSNGIQDEDLAYSDWIEIANQGAAAVNLEGYYLSNSTNSPTQWRFPSVTVPARSYLVVFASGKNRTTANGRLHTSFSLGAKGEYLALIAPDAKTVLSAFGPQYPRQIQDVSYGRSSPDGPLRYFSIPTPGTANSSTGFIDLVADTKFSHDRGFYSNPFPLEITCATPGVTIRYTTNGTPPSLTNGLVYSGPITIAGTTVLRAAAFRTGYQPSDVDTQSYLFTSDIITQASNGQPPAGWPASWGANTRDYGMDPEVVTNALYRNTIQKDLLTLPSFSVVTELRHLFDPSTGIYANPGQDGRDWERPCSLELIYPDGTRGFQINAGIRIRGGFSRSTGNPKHALRFFFRDEYGAPKLNYPVFGENAASSFDAFDLRTFQNYSWSFQADPRGIFMRDQFSRDTQLAMGHQAERGDYYHLYINGMYWGIYNSCERPEASYGETYFGGNKDNYDVIKVEAGPYTINATDGNLNAWTRLYNAGRTGFTTDEAYYKIQGRNTDGTENPAYENLVDLPNLIDYMLVIIYGGNLDAPISNFLGNSSPNNWYGMRDRTGRTGFRFFSHDAEHTLLDVNQNRTGPFSAGDSSVTKSNPQWIWQKLSAHPEFKLLVADHIQRHFFNGGTLTPEKVRERILSRAAQIERAVVAESARWGDAKRATPLTLSDWRNALTNLMTSYVPRRSAIVLGQLQAKGLYPNVAAPVFGQHGGAVQRGYSLQVTAPAGSTVHYTTDGTDPRLRGGAVSPSARNSTSIPLNESVRVRARTLLNGVWSALVEADFSIIQTFREVLITEIMYNPPGETGIDGESFEFVELKNIGSVELDLSGVRLDGAVRFTFPNGTRLSPGRHTVVISDPAGFTNRYPAVRFAGVYEGRLSNGGETLSLLHATGTPITAVKYSDSAPWPELADGAGFSLTTVDPNRNPDPNNPANWRLSSRPLGTPGSDEPNPAIPPVLINEVLTHTDPPALDTVELYNPGNTPVDIGNWLLTDDRNTPDKYRIPAGTIIPAGGYLLITEREFNANPSSPKSFSLSSHGDEIYLFSATPQGAPNGFSDGFGFSAAENGVSFGRHTNSSEQIQYPPQISPTPGSANSGPRVGPVVFTEISYHPKPGEEEFLELKNRSSETVKFFDPANPTNTWRINGVGFDFPAGFELAPGAMVLVVPRSPDLFRSRYSIPATIPILGPYPGSLQDGSERIELLRPDSPDVLPDGTVFVPYLLVDGLRYSDQLPWPPNANGEGISIERTRLNAHADDPINWKASVSGPSPGQDASGNRPPRVNPIPDIVINTSSFPVVTNFLATASDDGQPNPPGRVQFSWSSVNGPAPVLFSNTNQAQTAATFLGVGTYRIRATADDGEATASSDFTVTIGRNSGDALLISAGSTWKFLDSGEDLGTAWKEAGFNDSAWKAGKAQLGYGDGDEVTTVGFGADANNKFPTTYFRHTFAVSDAGSVRDLKLRLLRDDGAVIYLNGVEVFRSNMPEGAVEFATRSNATVSGDEETTVFVEGLIDTGALRSGANTIAVEIHQVNATSTDLSFDLELRAAVEPPNQPPVVLAGPDRSIALGNPVTLTGAAADDGLPLNPGRITNLWVRVNGPGTVSFQNSTALETRATFDSAGTHILRLIAGDGASLASDDVQVVVTGVTFSDWQKLHFTAAELSNPNLSGPGADPDRDGHSNQAEFQAGTNPRDPASRLALAVLVNQDGSLRLRFNSAAGVGYSLQSAENPASGPWTKVQDIQPTAAVTALEIQQPSPGLRAQRYYRIVTPMQP